MQKSQNTSDTMRNRILATLIFFTRLPFWRLADVPKECYERVVPLWPLAGWLTGGTMTAVFLLSSHFLPFSISLILAILSRILITGALHEDGFADFCDGFGGGTTRQRILEIMKDSHIGTYGVLSLILYYLLLYHTLSYALFYSPFILLFADVICKYISSTIVYFLPYARKETEAKNQLIYSQVTRKEKIISFLLTVLPVLLLALINPQSQILPLLLRLLLSTSAASLTAALLFIYMNKRIQGYTGDCCGATFIITETVFYLTILLPTSL